MAAVTSAVIGAGTAVYASSQQKKAAKKAAKTAEKAQEAADPYAPYRGDAAKKLNDLSSGKTDVSTTASYAARVQAAERTMASQGYTGSGKALVEAANAGAAAYQQEFDNLAMLAGATTGTTNAANVSSNTINTQQSAGNAAANQTSQIGQGIAAVVGTFNKGAT